MDTVATAGWGDRISFALDVVHELAEERQDHLTNPDSESGERWTGRQVVAHMAELLDYWMVEAARVAASELPQPFGRPKSDPARLTAVADGRREPITALVAALDAKAAQVASWLDGLEDEELARCGEHFKRGPMTVARIVEHFVVEHLEEHAAQLVSTTPDLRGD